MGASLACPHRPHGCEYECSCLATETGLFRAPAQRRVYYIGCVRVEQIIREGDAYLADHRYSDQQW